MLDNTGTWLYFLSKLQYGCGRIKGGRQKRYFPNNDIKANHQGILKKAVSFICEIMIFTVIYVINVYFK